MVYSNFWKLRSFKVTLVKSVSSLIGTSLSYSDPLRSYTRLMYFLDAWHIFRYNMIWVHSSTSSLSMVYTPYITDIRLSSSLRRWSAYRDILDKNAFNSTSLIVLRTNLLSLVKKKNSPDLPPSGPLKLTI